jgi:hypothetical protein
VSPRRARSLKDTGIALAVILAAFTIGRLEVAGTTATGPQDVMGWAPQEASDDPQSTCGDNAACLADEERQGAVGGW